MTGERLPRTGIGTDVHRLVPGRPMHLAGLLWPEEEVGPEGHSDGDVVLHAVWDSTVSVTVHLAVAVVSAAAQ